ncbi:hypothetical protein ST27_10105 [Xanthomonas phaseoli pv. phaseoli]|uniref:hypothetical protein n=1 Tax=Xanthomonas phaseoli TaxID=1985254 RepID=UPI0005959E29|nr:hypothetical protein [Xanthomonas phaseoli]KIJ00445.1 hypothetical protein ST27_10105 [Xanthomonas phaseoli pv. phaseoli]UZB30966.1 hypothetical protein OM951_11085 [Xanthomonas phaseoli pv. phaseoli]
MRERPILFNGAMVRAILSGAKTQTRRSAKGMALDWLENAKFTPQYVADPANDMCPFGQPGDRLWVRETTLVDRTTSDSAELARYSADQQPVCYPVGTGNGYDGAWQLWWYSRDTCPNIHMPRSACRLVLEITDVRVERLQAISEADALAEGAMEWAGEQSTPIRDLNAGDERIAFKALWESTGGDWDANPWVWVISFKRLP